MVYDNDGQKLVYTNWRSNQPDGDGDCTEVCPDHEGKWNDINCASKKPFVCQIPLTASLIPTVSTATRGLNLIYIQIKRIMSLFLFSDPFNCFALPASDGKLVKVTTM